MPKSILRSKTFWFNVLTVAVYVVANYSNLLKIPAEYAGAFLAVGNVVLRMISGQPVNIMGPGRVIGFLLLAAVIGGSSGCADFSSKAASVASVASQASGAVQGLVDVAMAAPVDDATKGKIAEYGQWAKLATDSVAGVSSSLAKSDAVEQAAGTVAAINNIVQAAPVQQECKGTASNWSAWALLAIKAAALSCRW